MLDSEDLVFVTRRSPTPIVWKRAKAASRSCQLGGDDRTKIDMVGRQLWIGVEVGLGDEAVGEQQGGADEVGVAGEGRETLVRRVAVAGGSEGQDLPQRGPVSATKSTHSMGCGAEVADPEVGAQDWLGAAESRWRVGREVESFHGWAIQAALRRGIQPELASDERATVRGVRNRGGSDVPVETIPQKVLDNGSRKADKPAYFVRGSGGWNPVSWATYAQEVTGAAKALMALGVEAGDKVTILGFNRPEWVIMDVAAMAIGAVPAGIYTTNSPEECKYIISHAEAVVLLAEDEGQWNKIDAIRDQVPSLRQVVMMKGAAEIDDDMVTSWDEFVAAGAERQRRRLPSQG